MAGARDQGRITLVVRGLHVNVARERAFLGNKKRDIFSNKALEVNRGHIPVTVCGTLA